MDAAPTLGCGGLGMLSSIDRVWWLEASSGLCGVGLALSHRS